MLEGLTKLAAFVNQEGWMPDWNWKYLCHSHSNVGKQPNNSPICDQKSIKIFIYRMAMFFKCVRNILQHKASALPIPDIIRTAPDWYRDSGLYTVHVIGVFRQRPRDATEYWYCNIPRREKILFSFMLILNKVCQYFCHTCCLPMYEWPLCCHDTTPSRAQCQGHEVDTSLGLHILSP